MLLKCLGPSTPQLLLIDLTKDNGSSTIQVVNPMLGLHTLANNIAWPQTITHNIGGIRVRVYLPAQYSDSETYKYPLLVNL